MLLGACVTPQAAVLMLSNLTHDMWVCDSIPQFKPRDRRDGFSNNVGRNPESNMKFLRSAPTKIGSTSLHDVQSACLNLANGDSIVRMQSIPPDVVAVWRHMEKHRDGKCLKAGTMNDFFAVSNRTDSVHLKTGLGAQKLLSSNVDGKTVEMEHKVKRATQLPKKVSFDVAVNSISSMSPSLEGSHSEDGWSPGGST